MGGQSPLAPIPRGRPAGPTSSRGCGFDPPSDPWAIIVYADRMGFQHLSPSWALRHNL